MRFLALVLAVLPACNDTLVQPGGGASEHHDITITDPAPPMQLRIGSCRADQDACADLCAAVARANNFGGSVVNCNVTFDSSTTYVSMDIGFFGGVGVGAP